MILRKYIPAIAVSLIMLASCTPARVQRTDEALGAIMDEYKIVGLAVAVVKDGEFLYNKSFGYKNLETGTPLSNGDIVRIASVSKSFTATALMQFVDKGVISLDDDVSDLIGFRVRNPHHPDIPITLKMILSHTSSIMDKEDDYFTLDHINPAVNGDCTDSYYTYAPGEQYNYSNMAINLAGAIIEKLSGVRFDDYIRENIIWKLGLYGGHNVDSLDAGKFATIYKNINGEYVASDGPYKSRSEDMPNYIIGYSAPIFSPTGGVKMSVEDLAKYMMMHINYGELNGVRIISTESAKAMQTPVPFTKEGAINTYCLGLGQLPYQTDDPKYNVPGNYLIGHSAGSYGLSGIMIWSPSDKWGIVAMATGLTAVPGRSFLQHITTEIYHACVEEK